jgi:septum formation protein
MSPRGEPNPAPRPPLFLASQSPRRRQLLAQHSIAHEAIHPGIDDAELSPGRVSAAHWVAALAYLKAMAGLMLLRARGHSGPLLILGADTACVKATRLIGTPTTPREAEEILRTLQDGQHRVITGIALIRQDSPREPPARTLLADAARVTLGHLGDRRIRDYIASEGWKGKAGAYNLLERIEAGWPINYEGDPTTIMGLPMQRLLRLLRAHEATPTQPTHS